MAAEIHLNDIGTSFRATIKDEDAAVVDISAATVKTLKFTKPDETVVTKTASLVNDGTDGKMEYITEDGDLDTVGLWKVQGFVTVGGGSWHTDIHQFKVHGNLS